jgi:hypothetical protein
LPKCPWQFLSLSTILLKVMFVERDKMSSADDNLRYSSFLPILKRLVMEKLAQKMEAMAV